MMEPLYILSCVAVNCYVMITGYFLIDCYIVRWNGLIRTWGQTFFYSVFFMVLAYLMNDTIRKKDVLNALFPIYNGTYWFVTSYVGLLLMAPFLSLIVKGFNKRQYVIMLAILFFMCFQFLYGRVYAGFTSVLWFSFVFLVAGYFRLFGVPSLWEKYKIFVFVFIWIVIFLFGTLINIIRGGDFELVSSAYDGPMIFLSSSLFVLFLQNNARTVSNGKTKQILSRIAQYTFGVYLIHENHYIHAFLWKEVIPAEYNGLMFFYCILTCLLIFCICIIIDYIRMILFKLIRVNTLFDIVSKKLPQL